MHLCRARTTAVHSGETAAAMPATAGRVRMPHGNRVSSSSALKMTGIWTNTIGYDPYAAEGGGADAEDEANAFEQAQGLMALAKLSNTGVRFNKSTSMLRT